MGQASFLSRVFLPDVSFFLKISLSHFLYVRCKYMRIIRFSILLFAGLTFASCDSSIEDIVTFPSSDKQYVLVVITELQAANDPTPFWTHISLRQPDENLRKIPGNVLKLVGRGSTAAEWRDASMVTVYLPHEITGSELNHIPDTKEIGGITIKFVTREKGRD